MFFPFRRPSTAPAAPPPELAHRREKCPISRVRLRTGTLEPWLLVKYRDAVQVLQTGDDGTAWSKDRRRSGYPEISPVAPAALSSPTFVYLDEPDRHHDRAAIDRLLSPENIDRGWPGLVHKVVNALLDRLSGRPSVDIHAEFGLRVPVYIIYTLLGAPEADLEQLTQWATANLRPKVPATEIAIAQQNLLAYLTRLIDQRRLEPRNDITSQLLAQETSSSGCALETAALLRILTPMTVTATITHLISYGLILLLQERQREQTTSTLYNQLRLHPDQEDLIPAFVDEVCRLHTSSTVALARVATRDVQLGGPATDGGRLVRAGEGILISLQSANRDEDVFDCPDQIDLC
ncbi:cytochrome P450, partial [Aspergillus saccharolyticus JOP 1030-1]